MSCVMRLTKVEDMLRFQDVCSICFQPSAGLFDGDRHQRTGSRILPLYSPLRMYVDDSFVFHFYLKSRHYSTSGNKECSQATPFHLTRLFELRKSCWELCDSQRVWKSQIIECFSGKIGRFFSETHFCDEKMGILRDFVRYFPNFFPWNLFSFPRNLFFFPRDFENVRQNCTNKPLVLHKRAVVCSKPSLNSENSSEKS